MFFGMLTAGAALIEAVAVFVWIRGAHPLIAGAIALAGVVLLLAGHAYLERKEDQSKTG